MALPVLQVIIGSTRPGRVGPAIANWFADEAMSHGGLLVELVDVADYGLPVLDEPEQANLRRYTKEHTKQWSATISRADCFVFVIPEYNHGLNGATKNALDFLYHEWRYKPAGIVSYGGASLGTRAAQALKPVLSALKMFPVGDVAASLKSSPVVEGTFTATEGLTRSAQALLDELVTLTPALMEVRSAQRRSGVRS